MPLENEPVALDTPSQVNLDPEIDVIEDAEEKLVPPEIETELRVLLQEAEKEDEDIRLRQLKVWRKIEEYMKGYFDIFWDESARDYRQLNSLSDDEDDDVYSKNLNVFRAHCESILAALSIKIPKTEFVPDDAEDPSDVETAQAMSKITQLIQKHNKAELNLIRALQILWNQGTVCAYNYYRTDPRFGTIVTPETTQKEIFVYDVWCQNCYVHLGTVKETKPVEPMQCPACDTVNVPIAVEYPETIERITGYRNDPKGRECFEFFGPKNVKFSFWARRQEHLPYLLLKFETHYAMLKSQFPGISELIDKTSNAGGYDTYERYMRLAPEYFGQVPQQLNTIKTLWVRPWLYETIVDDDNKAYFYNKWPNGLCVTYVDENLASVCNENMDDHWTLSYDPMAEFIHGEPLGKVLVPVQEMENDIVDLSFQTIEYGITETFVNPKVVDFRKYGMEKAAPGMLTPATPVAGQSLSDGFYQNKPAILSKEVENFHDRLEKAGQFLVSDFPSVFGGPQEGSKTAFEYNKSNAQALQRLSNIWKRICDLWSGMMAKCCVEYIENMKEDEKFVQKENGKYINVWIRKESTTGKVGHVEPETSEGLPQSWEQRWGLIQELLKMGNPAVEAVLLSPENAELMKQAIAMPEFYIPGENDRNKQYGEIYDLISGESPAQVDVVIDDHVVHMRIIKNYLTSPKGIHLYKTNPQAYQAIVIHYIEHETAQAQRGMVQSGAAPAGQPPESANPGTAQ